MAMKGVSDDFKMLSMGQPGIGAGDGVTESGSSMGSR